MPTFAISAPVTPSKTSTLGLSSGHVGSLRYIQQDMEDKNHRLKVKLLLSRPPPNIVGLIILWHPKLKGPTLQTSQHWSVNSPVVIQGLHLLPHQRLFHPRHLSHLQAYRRRLSHRCIRTRLATLRLLLLRRIRLQPQDRQRPVISTQLLCLKYQVRHLHLHQHLATNPTEV
jgi:hypothetical protein